MTDKNKQLSAEEVEAQMNGANNDDFFNSNNEAKGSFFKFTNPGDSIRGVLVGRNQVDANGIYPAQIVYELKTATGIVKVGLNVTKTFVHDALKFVKNGTEIGFKFTEWFETEASKKNPNISKAKTIKVFIGKMDPNYLAEDLDSNISVDEIPFK